MLVATASSGAECVYVGPDGHGAWFEPSYLVVDHGAGNLRWCQADGDGNGGIAECPAGDGGVAEIEYVFEGSTMQFDGKVWSRVCGDDNSPLDIGYGE